MPRLDQITLAALELIASAFTENLAWEEVGERACKSIPEGFVIFLN